MGLIDVEVNDVPFDVVLTGDVNRDGDDLWLGRFTSGSATSPGTRRSTCCSPSATATP